MMWRLLQPVVGFAAVIVPAAVAAQRATIVGEVVVKSSAVAVSYAVIGGKPGIADRFTTGEGKFVLRDVSPGQLTLTARHIGYAPLDTTLDVAAGDTIRLRLELALVTIQLPAVRSLAQRCAHPGGVNTQLSAELQVLFDQVKQNAERNRLLAASYPFEVVVERKITKPEPALEARFVAYDTVVRSSDRKWRYSPGNMLGTREFLVIHHTDCGSYRYSNEDLYRVLSEAGIDAGGYDFLPIADLEESVREDVALIAGSPLMLPGIHVTGMIFDVHNGLLHQVCDADTLGPQAAKG